MPTKNMTSKSRAPELREGVIGKEAKLKLAIQYAVPRNSVPTRPQFRRWVQAALTQDAEILLRIVDETEGLRLNCDFRGSNYATNVLTFVYDDVRQLSGDIVLCAPVVKKEAEQQHKNLTAHYAHLTVHGVLHLQGYDHENDAAATVMEQLETQIMMRLGYSDPYSEDQPAVERF